jgi:hypothetical protein
MFAVVYPPNFYAQAAAREQPKLRKLPFALVDGEPPSERVIAANRAAMSLGLEVGMTKPQVQTFPEVVTSNDNRHTKALPILSCTPLLVLSHHVSNTFTPTQAHTHSTSRA